MRICIIGAGLSGLAAAHAAREAGHDIVVVEAKPYAGGLSQTLRHGDVVTETDTAGRQHHQTCLIDPGLHLNAGPGRLPHHHLRVLTLCRRLAVPLEPYLMASDAAWYVDADTGYRYRRRRIEHDMRGWIADLAWSDNDPAPMRDMIRAFGDLDGQGRYRGTPRAGIGDPLPIERLTRLRSWEHRCAQPLLLPWQPVMLTPTGGMDAIWRALLDTVADAVVYNAPVTAITTTDTDVTVRWHERGGIVTERFDWVVSSIPLPLMARLDLRGADPDWRRALAVPRFAAACKVGWQAQQRFWETEGIFGGISYTSGLIQQFWYPSTGALTAGAAVVTGAYAAYEAAERLGRMSVGQRLDTARAQGAQLHPEVADEAVVPDRTGVTVAWHRVPYQAGGWCHWNPAAGDHATAFVRLQSPSGRIALIGDQVSSWPGWQEGCLESVERAMAVVEGRQPRLHDAVPDSRALTVGDHPDIDGRM